MNMNEIKMIPIGDLMHHPENPRKDLGDLEELTASIKENGILQNLTVVPDLEKCKYLVVIGNRRFEAAQAAGLVELPCVISDMDHRTQIATMLEENMQRADLTVYEQAQGFQMMMDLGYRPEEIAEKTGFSETTVNRRLKMAELDKKTFQEACGKQITIEALDQLGKLENIEARNELLKEYGESNFDWKLNRMLKVQQADKVRPKALEMLEAAKIKRIPEKDKVYTYGKYDQLYPQTLELEKWDGKRNFIPKTDDELFYMENGTDILFYVKQKKKKTEANKKTPEELEEEKRIALAWKTAERATETATELRQKFVEGLKVSPKNAMEMMQWALVAAIGCMFSYDTPTNKLRKEIPITSYDRSETMDQIRKWIMDMPQSKWPAVILTFFHGEGQADRIGYADGARYKMPSYKQNKQLDLCYEWLTQFGYQMSDEEIRMMGGTHECFQEVLQV